MAMNARTGSPSGRWATGSDVLIRVLEGVRAVESLDDVLDAVSEVLDAVPPPQAELPKLDAVLQAGLHRLISIARSDDHEDVVLTSLVDRARLLGNDTLHDADEDPVLRLRRYALAADALLEHLISLRPRLAIEPPPPIPPPTEPQVLPMTTHQRFLAGEVNFCPASDFPPAASYSSSVHVKAQCAVFLGWEKSPGNRHLLDAANDLHDWYWGVARALEKTQTTPLALKSNAEWERHQATVAKGMKLVGDNDAEVRGAISEGREGQALHHIQDVAQIVRAMACVLDVQEHYTPAIRHQETRMAAAPRAVPAPPFSHFPPFNPHFTGGTS
jgi:hypothetical protein